ncbi:MAG: hypothetical protein DPW09_29910 [Anaerolineae bacterium]|nr:hypothetical protein [Anaerolineae bacterium]
MAKKKNKGPSKARQKRDRAILQIENTCVQWKVPAYVAVQILAGELKRDDLFDYPRREQWQAEYRQEVEPNQPEKQIKRLRAENIRTHLNFNRDETLAVLCGAWTAAAAIKRASERREQEDRREQQKQFEAAQRAWLVEATATLRQLDLPADLIRAILPFQSNVDPALSAPFEAEQRWQRCLDESGFATPSDLLAAWREQRVLTVEKLHLARALQAKRAERQAEREAKRKELCYKSTAIQLLGLTPTGFERLSAELGLEPEKIVENPHYSSAAPAKLYRRLTIEQLIDDPRLATFRPKTRKPVDYTTKFIKRYRGNAAAAITDAAQAMFNLNRYVKHETCSARNRREIYGLKNDLIRWLYEAGFCREAYLHLKELEAQECWNCSGTRVAYYDDYGVDTCRRCRGTGIYRGKRTLKFVVFRFFINEQPFSWHQRFEDVDFEVKFTGDQQQMPEIEIKELEIPQRKLTEAKALVKWFLSNCQQTRPVVEASVMPQVVLTRS